MLGASFRSRSGVDSLRNRAYQRIKEKIVSGAIPPASLIDEKALSREMKLGYTPIREALRWLALESLVVILPRRGTIVADLNASDLQRIYEIRQELLPFAFRLAAARATPGQILAMETYMEKSNESIATGDLPELLAVGRKIQSLIIETCHNDFLVEVLERLNTQTLRYWRMERIDVPAFRKEVKQYRRIVAALKVRNQDLAARLVRGIIGGFHLAQMATI